MPQLVDAAPGDVQSQARANRVHEASARIEMGRGWRCRRPRIAASAPGPSRMDLGEQYLCSGMTKIELAHLNETGVEKQFAVGTAIARAGDSADCLFFILSGEVEVLVDTDLGTMALT